MGEQPIRSEEWKTKEHSKWDSIDIVSWIGQMEGFEVYAEKFRIVANFDELSEMDENDLLKFGLPRQFAFMLSRRIDTRATSFEFKATEKGDLITANRIMVQE